MIPWPHPWKLQAKASLIILLIVGGVILVTEWLHQYYVAELAKDAIHSKSLVLLRQIGARFKSEHQFQNATLREKYLNDLMSRNPDLVLLRVYGKKGNINEPPTLLTQVGATQEISSDIPPLVIQTFLSKEPKGLFQNQQGDDRLKLSTPLSIEGKTTGVIYAEYWTGQLNTITRFFSQLVAHHPPDDGDWHRARIELFSLPTCHSSLRTAENWAGRSGKRPMGHAGAHRKER